MYIGLGTHLPVHKDWQWGYDPPLGLQSAVLYRFASSRHYHLSCMRTWTGDAKFKFYSEGVYHRDDCATDRDHLNHAVTLVGYGTTDSGEGTQQGGTGACLSDMLSGLKACTV